MDLWRRLQNLGRCSSRDWQSDNARFLLRPRRCYLVRSVPVGVGSELMLFTVVEGEGDGTASGRRIAHRQCPEARPVHSVLGPVTAERSAGHEIAGHAGNLVDARACRGSQLRMIDLREFDSIVDRWQGASAGSVSINLLLTNAIFANMRSTGRGGLDGISTTRHQQHCNQGHFHGHPLERRQRRRREISASEASVGCANASAGHARSVLANKNNHHSRGSECQGARGRRVLDGPLRRVLVACALVGGKFEASRRRNNRSALHLKKGIRTSCGEAHLSEAICAVRSDVETVEAVSVGSRPRSDNFARHSAATTAPRNDRRRHDPKHNLHARKRAPDWGILSRAHVR